MNKTVNDSEQYNEYKEILDSHFPNAVEYKRSDENKWVDYIIYKVDDEELKTPLKKIIVTIYAKNKADIVSLGMGDEYNNKFPFTMGLSFSEFERYLLEIKNFIK